VLTACEQDQDGAPSWSCSQAVSKPVWHIPLLCVQWKTPDDGQRNCPKHVEFYSKTKFEKLVHLVGFIIRIYHDARSLERQIISISKFHRKNLHFPSNNGIHRNSCRCVASCNKSSLLYTKWNSSLFRHIINLFGALAMQSVHLKVRKEERNHFCLPSALQAGRSRVWFSMLSLEFFIEIILPVALRPWGWLRLLTEMSTRYIYWEIKATGA